MKTKWKGSGSILIRGGTRKSISSIPSGFERENWDSSRLRLASDQAGEGNGKPLQYSCPANPMDGGAWWAAVHRVARSQTRLSDFTFTFDLHALEKEMATHSSVLAWRIPGTGEAGGLPSLGSHRVGHAWSDLAAAAAVTKPGLEAIRSTFKASITITVSSCLALPHVSWLWLGNQRFNSKLAFKKNPNRNEWLYTPATLNQD